MSPIRWRALASTLRELCWRRAHQSLAGAPGSVLRAPCRQVALSKGDQGGRIQAVRGLSCLDRLLEASDSVSGTTGERVRRSKGSRGRLNQVVHFTLSGKRETACGQVDGLVHVAATAVGMTQADERPGNGCRVTEVLCHAQGLFPAPHGFLVPPGLGEHPHKVLQNHALEPDAFGLAGSCRLGIQRDQRLRQQGLGTAHVASGGVNGAQLHSGERIQPSVTDLVRKGKSPFPDFHRAIELAGESQGLESPRKHLGKSCAVTDLLGEACGFAQVLEEPLVVREHPERVHQVAADEVNAERRVLGGVGQFFIRASTACSRKATAGRYADRARAFRPACQRWVTAFSHISPRTA
jgi:hypothetical protein